MTVKVECSCGTRFAFEVEPVDGRMPQPVHCPSCGMDATDLANLGIGTGTDPPLARPIRIRERPASPEENVPDTSPGSRPWPERNSPLAAQSSATEHGPGSFWGDMTDCLSYPWRGSGVYILLGGTLFFALLNTLGSFGLAGLLISLVSGDGAGTGSSLTGGGLAALLISLVSGGYLSAYLIKVIQATAQGDDDAPSWPDFANLWDDILQPLFLVVASLVVAYLPLFLVNMFILSEIQPVLRILALAYAAFYWPMNLLAVAMFESGAALNPLLIAPSIVKVLGEYFLTCLATVLLIAVYSFAKGLEQFVFPLGAALLATFIFLYVAMVEMRMLGRLYWRNRTRLDWF